ncbi:hypothetical protein [Streptomyces prunicolor]
MSDTDVLRDLADGWHLCAALGLTSPTAAYLADGSSIALAALALTAGHRRPALTLTASSCMSWLAGTLIHHGSLL